MMPRYVADLLGLTSVSPILTVCVTLNFILERVKCMSWYFAGENLDPCLLAHASALWCARSRFRQFCSADVLLVKK